ncbi:general substrate transporter [Tirmania nivea]|nr:general substrate transporter [Tirmania nivea]
MSKLPKGERAAEVKSVVSGPVIAIGFTASMGGFIFGADTGQISGFLVMKDFLRRFAILQSDGSYAFSDVRAGTLVGMFSIGALLGSFGSGPISNRFGRKLGIMLGVLIYFAGTTIQICAINKWYQIVIGRLMAGSSIGIMSVLVPVYISESVPKEIRGGMVALFQLFITLGILVSYIINFGTSHVGNSAAWRIPLGLNYVWASILGGGMALLPESPRWLLGRDRREDTLKSLRFIAGKKHAEDGFKLIEAQYQEIAAMVQTDRNLPKTSWFSSFNPKRKIAYRTILGFVLQMLTQLTGANYFFYYGASNFKSIGISNSFVTQIILGVVNFSFTLPGMYAIERFGRRKPLLAGGIWQVIWLLVFGSVGTVYNPMTNKAVGAVLIVATCMFIVGFASTWGPGVWVATGEMFPLRVRAHSASFATAGNWGWNFLLTFFTPFITSSIEYKLGFVFAGTNLLGVLVVFFFYYESSSLSLEQVDIMYNDPHSKPWTSGSWVPPGHSSRHEASKSVSHNDSSSDEVVQNYALCDGMRNVDHSNINPDNIITEL